MKEKDSYDLQLNLLRGKSPSQRFAIMVDLIGSQIEAMRSGIRHRNPKISDKEVKKCLQKRMKQIYSLKH